MEFVDMKIVDKSVHMPDIRLTYPDKKLVHVFDSDWSLKFHSEEYISILAPSVIRNFLIQMPAAFQKENINYHLDRCQRYAGRNHLIASNCYHYRTVSKTETDLNEHFMPRKIGVRIMELYPDSQLYQVTILCHHYNYCEETPFSQDSVDVIYNALDGQISLVNSSSIGIEYLSELTEYHNDLTKLREKSIRISL